MPPKHGSKESEPIKKWVPVSRPPPEKEVETQDIKKEAPKVRETGKNRRRKPASVQPEPEIPEIPEPKRRSRKPKPKAKPLEPKPEPELEPKPESASPEPKTQPKAKPAAKKKRRGSAKADAPVAEEPKVPEAVPPVVKEEDTESSRSERIHGSDRPRTQSPNPRSDPSERQEQPKGTDGPARGLSEVESCDDLDLQVEEIAERLLRNLYSEKLGIQELISLMRHFQWSKDKNQCRIHQLLISILLDDFQSFPAWPEKELMLTGEFLGQLIRWDLIPDGGPLQFALCGILSAIKEPAGGLLFRFGHMALKQFLCRLANHDVATQLSRQISSPVPSAPPPPPHPPSCQEEEDLKHEERWLLMMLQKQAGQVGLPWHMVQSSLNRQLFMRMMVPQVCQLPPAARPSPGTGGAPVVTWMFGNAPKAPPKQGTLAWQEERREKEPKPSKTKKPAKKKAQASQAAPRLGRVQLPDFLEVDAESMKFKLSEDDLGPQVPASEPEAEDLDEAEAEELALLKEVLGF
ncbi:unnamed protein product [Effrenium voratum]|nr:unnamed protein product [Effrenium voratum]